MARILPRINRVLTTLIVIAMTDIFLGLALPCVPARGDELASPKTLDHAGPPTLAVTMIRCGEIP
jgi:hypothetical protein